MMTITDEIHGEGTFYATTGKDIERMLSKFLKKRGALGIVKKSKVAKLPVRTEGNGKRSITSLKQVLLGEKRIAKHGIAIVAAYEKQTIDHVRRLMPLPP